MIPFVAVGALRWNGGGVGVVFREVQPLSLRTSWLPVEDPPSEDTGEANIFERREDWLRGGERHSWRLKLTSCSSPASERAIVEPTADESISGGSSAEAASSARSSLSGECDESARLGKKIFLIASMATVNG